MDLNEISIWADIFEEIVQDTKNIYNTDEDNPGRNQNIKNGQQTSY